MPEDSYQLDIVTPEKPLFSGLVRHLRAPGVLGSFGVLIRHAPMVAAIGPGEVICTDAQTGEKLSFSIGGGVVQVTPGHVSVVAETGTH